MVELRRRPGRGRMADHTRGGDVSRGVVRRRRGGIVRLVAGVAIGRRARVTRRVAFEARLCQVGARQREVRSRVVEVRIRPHGHGVAGRAIGREAAGHVVRVGGALVVGPVAGVAVGRRGHVAGGVARRAIDVAMSTAERVAGRRLRMVVARRPPGRGAVAGHAVGAEAGRRVGRVGRAVVVGLVAGQAVGGSARERLAVAGGAGGRRMGPCQWEAQRVDEVAAAPRSREHAVAAVAGGVEAGQAMIGVARRLKGRLVAGVAVGGRPEVLSALGAGMAGVAVDLRVSPDQG